MKKKDIIKLIELYNKLKKNNELITINKDFKNYFFKVESIKDDLSILKNEIVNVISKSSNLIEEMNLLNCNHLVRRSFSYFLVDFSVCSICGKKIEADNCITYGYNDINRNNYYASFRTELDDEDYDISLINEEMIQKYIFEILENFDDEDVVDLVYEFKKLNFKDCNIIDKNKTKILR